MLKKYEELRRIDVLPFCETRESKDDKGKKIDVPYLNWAKCQDLLYDNGAEKVYFEPIVNEKTGSTLFMTDVAFEDKNKQFNRCFEVRVRIVIDDLDFIQNYPLLNGMYVVREDTINQLRLSNAQARAFVKGVAIRTGLGFGLWIKDDETAKIEPEEHYHDILKVKERVEQLITMKLQGGKTKEDICEELKIDEDTMKAYLSYYKILDRLEKAIAKL